MQQWWEALGLLGQIFATIAIPATLVLLIQTVLLIIGFSNTDDGGDISGISDTDGGVDLDTDMDAEVPDDASDTGADGDNGLALFSVRGIVAMLCIGGWSGIVLLDFGINPVFSIILAFIFGFAALVGIAFIMKAVAGLQSSGNINIGNAVGKTACVYIPIPSDMSGRGKVTVTVQETLTEIDAVTTAARKLATGETVRVVATDDAGVLVVEPLSGTTQSVK